MADVAIGAIDKKDPLVGVADPEGKLRRHGSGSGYDDSEKQAVMSVVEAMHNHRRLSARQISLLAIAGTIGAALFVGIGTSLRNGGPLSLLLGFIVWSSVIFSVAQCQIEMVTLLPLDGSFIRFAGRFVDDAWGMAAGYNYVLNQAALACFDITAFNTLIAFWKDDIHPAVFISVLIFIFFCLNIWTVSFFGEAEFWLAIGKVMLLFILMFYTLVTMCGGNPQGDAFGFRYWREPGAMREYINEGALGRFQGFIACIIGAAFVIAGPEYISMTAGEARDPRRVMPKAFNSITYRLVFFFIIGALSVGIVCPYDAPRLVGASGVSAANSPYVISMERLNIGVLPHIVNALIGTSIVSAANGYVFTTSRSLLSLSLAGQAPRFLSRLNRNGVPYICVIITIGFTCLSYLAVSAGTAKVLNWWISLVTASQLLNWIIMSSSWIRFNNAMKVQGLDRETFLPCRSRFQPYAAWYALIMATIVLIISGYTLFYPGAFKADEFIFQYGMVFIVILCYVGWKVVKRTKFLKGNEVDLVSDIQDINDYTQDIHEREDAQPKTKWDAISKKIF